jgi:hypothetical protein
MDESGIKIGFFNTEAGNTYDCLYFPDKKLVQAVGPRAGDPTEIGVLYEAAADSELDALDQVTDFIERGALN